MRVGFSCRWLTFRLNLPSLALPRGLRVSTLLLLVTLLALLLAWWRDHRRLQDQISKLQGQLLAIDKRNYSWDVSQLLGPPDTKGSGDLPTAWASATPDRQKEWLDLQFERSVQPSAIEIYETFNPGAVDRVSVFDPLGRERVVWRGQDPTSRMATRGVSRIPISTMWKTRRVKVYLDSPAVAGWNEIDAVALFDRRGRVQWVQNASASSSYRSGSRRGGFSNTPYLSSLFVPATP
jgi:hypothetical protein